MKKLGKLKLNQLSNDELNEKELSRILGGGNPGDCCCGCNYAGSGGSSSSDNKNANNAQGLHSPGCGSGSGSGSSKGSGSWPYIIANFTNAACSHPELC